MRECRVICDGCGHPIDGYVKPRQDNRDLCNPCSRKEEEDGLNAVVF